MISVIKALVKFRDQRQWKKFHTPENLAKSIIIEAGELLENFQWKNQALDLENVKEEVADVMAYCLLLCEHYGFDPEVILKEKIAKNEAKYPVETVKGKSTKYNRYK